MSDYNEFISKYDLSIPFTDEAAINFSNDIMSLDDFSFYCAWHSFGGKADVDSAIKVHQLIFNKLNTVLQDDEFVERICNRFRNQ